MGHLEVLKSPLVNKLIKSFKDSDDHKKAEVSSWERIPADGKELPLIFGIDGSLQPIEKDSPPYKKLAFVKTALVRIDQYALSEIDKDFPHPLALRDLLTDSALHHATVFPLRNMSIPGKSLYDGVRQIIFESMKDSLDGEPLETLKWIVYEKWSDRRRPLALFDCPHCEEREARLPYNAETGYCPGCEGELFVTDMLGFHLEMTENSAPEIVAKSYMNIHEALLMFTGIRHYWTTNKEYLTNCLFVKDGPLYFYSQYLKLVNPIRRFLAFARDEGYAVHIIGQEKSGKFYDHLELVGRAAPSNSLYILDNNYIRNEIRQKPSFITPYGKDTNYGAKVFVKLNNYHRMILNIPTGEFVANPSINNLIGAKRIFTTIPTIISSRYEGALLPIELAHGIASLSTYPSAEILKIFAGI
ncbi:MAG: hypothetical protein ACFFD2_05395 [Promethearchaeota archaeon]